MIVIGLSTGFALVFQDKKDLQSTVDNLSNYLANIPDTDEDKAQIFMVTDDRIDSAEVKENVFSLQDMFTPKKVIENG